MRARASPLISMPSSCPTWYTSSRACHLGTARARMSLGAVSAFIVRAVIPRRSLCCRTIPKSPSFRRRPSQTKTFSGVRSRCSAWPRCSFPSTSRMPAISRRAVVSDHPLGERDRKALRSPWRAYSSVRQYSTCPSGRINGNVSKTRIARGCPSSSCPKYASRSHPSMRALTLMQTISGTTGERPSRVARYTWPNPPSPSSRSMRYSISVSGLVTTWAGASTWRARSKRTRTDVALRVVAADAFFDIRMKLHYEPDRHRRSAGSVMESGSEHARRLLAAHFGPTRLVSAPSLSRPGRAVYLKLECELPTGSFKVRGAVYSLSVNIERRAIGEVVAASTGNHGAAVAFAARLLGEPLEHTKGTIVLIVSGSNVAPDLRPGRGQA